MKSFYIWITVVSILFPMVSSIADGETIPEKIQKGAALLNEGKLTDAEAVLAEVIQQDARHGPAHFLLGQIAMEQNRWKEAEEHLKIAVASNVRRPALAWHSLGKLQLLQHRYGEARTAFDQSLKQTPGFVPALVGRAQAALFLADTTAAMNDLQTAAEKSPEGSILFAELLLYLNREQDAIQQLNSSALQNSPLANAAGSLKIAISKPPESGKKLRSFLSENLGDPQSYLALAILEQRNGRDNPFLLQIAFQLDDQNPMPLLFLKKTGSAESMRPPKIPYPEIATKFSTAKNALKEGKSKEAGENVQQILQDRPLHIPAQLIALEAAEQQNNLWEALSRYEEISNVLPGIPSIESRLAVLAEKMEAHDLAECSIRKAIEIEPENGSHHHLFATILKSQDKIDAALKETELAIALGVKTAPIYETLGNLYYEKMEISQAIFALRKAVELDPHAASSIASFAISALTSEDYASLRELLEAHVRANPENVSTLYSLALIYINENRLDEAEKILTQLQKLAPGQQQIYYNLALVKYRLGKTQEGQKAMTRFQEIKEEQRVDFEKHTQALKLRLQAEDAFRNKKFDESIRIYSQLLSQKSTETEDLIALAKSYSATKNHRDALRIYEAALESTPYNIEALTGAAEAALGTGKNELATMYANRSNLLLKKCS